LRDIGIALEIHGSNLLTRRPRDDSPSVLFLVGAQHRDVGKGAARIPAELFGRLGIQEGEIIEVTGKRSTPAVALRPSASLPRRIGAA